MVGRPPDVDIALEMESSTVAPILIDGAFCRQTNINAGTA